MAHDVFISYSHKDKLIADAICARMEQNGIRCWYAPRDIAPGDSWMSAIMTAIENTKILILVFTGNSNESTQVLREINQAVKTAKIIIPFKLKDIEPNKDILYLLDVVHWLDAFSAPQEKSINQLVRQVKSLLSPVPDGDEDDASNRKDPSDQEKKQNTPDKGKAVKKIVITAALAAAAAAAGIAGYRLSTKKNVSRFYVYRDDGDPENHFLQKEKMWGLDETLVRNMEENCTDAPQSGKTCIRCEQVLAPGDWGGWLFLSGYTPEGENEPRLNDGSTDHQGIDLTGNTVLSFWAKGEKGGETAEFFTGGFGYDEWNNPSADYPDSLHKNTLGTVTLENKWKEYRIDLGSEDLGNVICGFGYALSESAEQGTDAKESAVVFYLDEICFENVQS